MHSAVNWYAVDADVVDPDWVTPLTVIPVFENIAYLNINKLDTLGERIEKVQWSIFLK